MNATKPNDKPTSQVMRWYYQATTITSANDGEDLCRHMALLGYKELMKNKTDT